ncbi:MAG: PASTA domain-containing protein [Muribaculaceae bacterium]
MKKVITFLKNHPIIANLIYMFFAGWIIILAALFFLDHWTHHGEESTVPKVTGMTFNEAQNLLGSAGLAVELSDSIYDSKRPAGSVVEQSPHPNAKVKPGRTVYLTIVAFTPKTVTVPHYLNMSSRSAKAAFEGLGIKNIRIVEVESEYKDLVLGAKVNGIPLKPGTRLPVTATVTLEVGKGYEASADTLSMEDELKDLFLAD